MSPSICRSLLFLLLPISNKIRVPSDLSLLFAPSNQSCESGSSAHYVVGDYGAIFHEHHLCHVALVLSGGVSPRFCITTEIVPASYRFAI